MLNAHDDYRQAEAAHAKLLQEHPELMIEEFKHKGGKH